MFGQVLTAMVTPFTADGQVDYAKAGELALYLMKNGSDGVVVAGTTGESPTLTREEKVKLFRAVKEKVGNQGAVIAGTGSNDTAGTVELTRRAAETGVDGAMLVVPYYNKPTQEGLYRHFTAVAEQTDLPILLYNVPGRTSCNLLPATVARLAKIHNIVAIKEASGNLDQVGEIIRLVPETFAVYSGDDSLTLPILSVGGVGVVSVASHLAGKKIKEMITRFISGDTKGAAQIHRDLLPLCKGLFMTTNPIPVKTALNLQGHNLGGFRLPLVEMNDGEREALAKLLRDYNLLWK